MRSGWALRMGIRTDATCIEAVRAVTHAVAHRDWRKKLLTATPTAKSHRRSTGLFRPREPGHRATAGCDEGCAPPKRWDVQPTPCPAPPRAVGPG